MKLSEQIRTGYWAKVRIQHPGHGIADSIGAAQIYDSDLADKIEELEDQLERAIQLLERAIQLAENLSK